MGTFLNVSDFVLDGEVEAAYAELNELKSGTKIAGVTLSSAAPKHVDKAPRLPSTLLAEESRDDMEYGLDDVTSTRADDTTAADTALSTLLDDDTEFLTNDGTTFSTKDLNQATSGDSSQSSAHSQSLLSYFLEQQTRLGSQYDFHQDGELRDDEGFIVERPVTEENAIKDGEFGQEVELASTHENSCFKQLPKAVWPEFSGETVELDPKSKKANRMAVHISASTTANSSDGNRSRNKVQTKGSKSRTLSLSSPKALKGFFKKKSKQTESEGSLHTPKCSKRLPVSSPRRWKNSNSTPKAGDASSKDYIASIPASSQLKNRSNPTKLGDASSKGYLASRKIGTAAAAVASSTPDGQSVPNSTQKKAQILHQKRQGPRQDSMPSQPPSVQLNNTAEDSYDDIVFASPCDASESEKQSSGASDDDKRLLGPTSMADINPASPDNDNNTVTSPLMAGADMAGIKLCSPMACTAIMEGASMAADLDDTRNVVERAADVTYDAVQFCFEDTVGKSYTGGNSLVGEKDHITLELGDLGETIKNTGVEMDIAGLFLSSDGELCGGQGIISLGSEQSSIDTESFYEREEIEGMFIDTSPEDQPEDQPVKSSKRFSLRLPTSPFKRKSVKGIIDEDMFMTDILNEIKLEQDKQNKEINSVHEGLEGVMETKVESEDHYDLPQGFSDLIANTIAEEAVLSCLNENRNKI